MSDDAEAAGCGEEERVPAPGIETLEAALGHRFGDRRLLEIACRHASYANETPGVESNERLEFLGDAVIGMVVARELYDANPAWREGDLTRALHRLVDRRGLAGLARALDLGAYLHLGRTERQSAGEQKDSILADAMEAVIGAMYLDAGVAPVAALAHAHFADALQSDAPKVERDPKTLFQESIMAKYGFFPSYEIVHDTDREGDEERFEVAVRVGDELWGRGVGRTKRAAERQAAKRGLERLPASEVAS